MASPSAFRAQYLAAKRENERRSKPKAKPKARKAPEPGLKDYATSGLSALYAAANPQQTAFAIGKDLVEAAPGIASDVVDYFGSNSPMDVVSDIGSGLRRAGSYMLDNPVSTAADFTPIVGDVKGFGEDIQRAAELRAAGNPLAARNIERVALPLAVASIVPGIGEARGAGKMAVRAAEDARGVRLNPKDYLDQIEAADAALSGPAARAITDFVGHEPGTFAAKTGPGFGVMLRDKLEDAFAARPKGEAQEARAALDAAFAPVREHLRGLSGDTIKLHRFQRTPEYHGDNPVPPRNVLSWTSDPDVAAEFAGVRYGEQPPLADEDILRAEQELADTGKTAVGPYTFERNPEFPEYIDMYHDGEYITDTDNPRAVLEDYNAGIRDANERRNQLLSSILTADVPLEDVTWVTNRAGQQEFIVRNRPGTAHYVDTEGRMGTAPTTFAVPRAAEDAAREGAERSALAGERRFSEAPFDPAEFGVLVRDKPRTEAMRARYQYKADVPQPKTVSIADLAGRPFITTMADRSAASSKLLGVNGTEFNEPVDLLGGQDFMFDPTTEGLVWASAPGVVTPMRDVAAELADRYGVEPLYLPFRMTGSGSDFSTMTGETMMRYAAENLGKRALSRLNKRLRAEIPQLGDFAGIETPEGIAQYSALPGRKRVAFTDILDEAAPEGGLTLGQTRLLIAAPEQVDAPKFFLQNVGEVDPSADIVPVSGHPSYPAGLPGRGLGALAENINVMQVLPELAARFRVKDPSQFSGSPVKLSPEEAAAYGRSRMDPGQLLRTSVQSGFLSDELVDEILSGQKR